MDALSLLRTKKRSIHWLNIFYLVTSINAFVSTAKNKWGPNFSKFSHQGVTSTSDEKTPLEFEKKLTTVDVLSLDTIRASLIRQEETIIFALIERSQFFQNSVVYETGGIKNLEVCNDDGCVDLSFLEYMLVGTEKLHGSVRRYTSPEEHAFFPEFLQEGILKNLEELEYPKDLLSPKGGANKINFNKTLLRRYISDIVPSITKRGDDEQYGSTVLADIAVLQALSRRIHYGKFVAESKYLENPAGYQALVDKGDVDGVWDLLTNMEVERKVLRRAKLKAATYGQDPLLSNLPEIEGHSDYTTVVAAAAAAAAVGAVEAMEDTSWKKLGKVEPSVIESIYRDFIIPLTKDIEVAYLFLRCGKEAPKSRV